MTQAANRLIVALDTDDAMTLVPELHEAGVTFFKFNAGSLMNRALFWQTLARIQMRDCDFFLDLKIYDIEDTVHAVARRAFDLGARFLTVHATPSMLDAALCAKPPGDYTKVLAIGMLTDGNGAASNGVDVYQADGLICSVIRAAAWPRAARGSLITVCPGIRRSQVCESTAPWVFENEATNNHVNPATPTEAIRAGADYLVVGRPITSAYDPAAAARAIIAEMKEASR